jgi:hypothetical protein
MKVTVIYQGSIEIEVDAPFQALPRNDREAIEKSALDEIDTWSEALFYERLELELIDITY